MGTGAGSGIFQHSDKARFSGAIQVGGVGGTLATRAVLGIRSYGIVRNRKVFTIVRISIPDVSNIAFGCLAFR